MSRPRARIVIAYWCRLNLRPGEGRESRGTARAARKVFGYVRTTLAGHEGGDGKLETKRQVARALSSSNTSPRDDDERAC